MKKRREDDVEANRRAWDLAAPHHRRHAQYDRLLAGFARPGFSCLDETKTERLRAIGVAGRDVAQICCNNGPELLSAIVTACLEQGLALEHLREYPHNIAEAAKTVFEGPGGPTAAQLHPGGAQGRGGLTGSNARL